MNTKDKKMRLTIRLDKQSSDFVDEQSHELGLSPSAFVRQMIYTSMYAQKTVKKVITETIQNQIESAGKASNDENNKVNIDNLV